MKEQGQPWDQRLGKGGKQTRVEFCLGKGLRSLSRVPHPHSVSDLDEGGGRAKDRGTVKSTRY